jgi:hypothetical protein
MKHNKSTFLYPEYLSKLSGTHSNCQGQQSLQCSRHTLNQFYHQYHKARHHSSINFLTGLSKVHNGTWKYLRHLIGPTIQFHDHVTRPLEKVKSLLKWGGTRSRWKTISFTFLTSGPTKANTCIKFFSSRCCVQKKVLPPTHT